MTVGWSRFALRFAQYYQSLTTTDLWTPPRLRNREWMFIPWGGRAVDRHRGFASHSQLLGYLQQRGPHSSFHSTAYYRNPNERIMNEKGWLGADLIFDLDGDHLPGVSDADFPTMIEKIQEQAWSLWSDFLEPEFGISREHSQFSFSGHRGFHIHVRDSALMGLDSNARREIVSYIRGEGLEVDAVLTGGDSGWQTRIEVGKQSVVEKLQLISEGKAESKSLLNEFHGLLNERGNSKGKNIGPNRIKNLADLVTSEDRLNRLNDDHNLSVFGKETSIFWDLVRKDSSVVLGTAGETDENVTVDVKRVIRWIGSLHGKCGLRVTEIPFERLDPDGNNPFDPLMESIALKGGKSSNIELIRDDVTARINGVEVSGGTGDVFEVEDAMATFLCLKGWGEVTT